MASLKLQLISYSQDKRESLAQALLKLDDSISVGTLSIDDIESLAGEGGFLPVFIGYEDVETVVEALKTLSDKVACSYSSVAVVVDANLLTGQDRLLEAGVTWIIPEPTAPRQLLNTFKEIFELKAEAAGLESQLQMANQIAFDAMTSCSEVGQILTFTEEILSCDNAGTVVEKIFVLGEQLQLNLRFKIEKGKDAGIYCPDGRDGSNDENLFEKLTKSEHRLFSVDDLSVYLQEYCTIVIKDMPASDEKRCGVLRDLLGHIGKTVESKLVSLHAQELLNNETLLAMDALRQIQKTE